MDGWVGIGATFTQCPKFFDAKFHLERTPMQSPTFCAHGRPFGLHWAPIYTKWAPMGTKCRALLPCAWANHYFVYVFSVTCLVLRHVLGYLYDQQLHH